MGNNNCTVLGEENKQIITSFLSKLHTCTISLTTLKPPGPTTDPASKYPVKTWEIMNYELETWRQLPKEHLLYTIEWRKNQSCSFISNEKNSVKDSDPTGWPAQAKAIPPHVAETMTTTRSDINLNIRHFKQQWAI